MKIEAELKYSKDHEWVRAEGNRAFVGITDHAQHSLGEIVFVELPEVGKMLSEGGILGVVESVKAASDVYTPIAGKVTAVNEDLVDKPGSINESPYESWIAVLETSNDTAPDNLMDASAYEAFCAREE